MPNPNDFAVFILTNGRPDNVITYDTLKKSGYTGPIFLLVNSLDKTRQKYIEKFKEEVIVFEQKNVENLFDIGDNFYNLGSVIYARNSSFGIAEKLGYKYFIQLDDDYTGFQYRFDNEFHYKPKSLKNLDLVFKSIFKFFISSPLISSVALAQGGDFIGGIEGAFSKGVYLKRKCMNSFFCSTERPFFFIGRLNDDVNTYVRLSSIGSIFFTTNQVNLNQLQTQKNSGGMTENYLESGTYVKSFYSVMFMPSSVKIGMIRGRAASRIHHRINWKSTAPMILRESQKK